MSLLSIQLIFLVSHAFIPTLRTYILWETRVFNSSVLCFASCLHHTYGRHNWLSIICSYYKKIPAERDQFPTWHEQSYISIIYGSTLSTPGMAPPSGRAPHMMFRTKQSHSSSKYISTQFLYDVAPRIQWKHSWSLETRRMIFNSEDNYKVTYHTDSKRCWKKFANTA